MCGHPGCVAYAVGGTDDCVVHRAPGSARLCETCAGTGWLIGPPSLPCPQCGGVGLADYARRTSRRGKDRSKVKVDRRALIQLAQDMD